MKIKKEWKKGKKNEKEWKIKKTTFAKEKKETKERQKIIETSARKSYKRKFKIYKI